MRFLSIRKVIALALCASLFSSDAFAVITNVRRYPSDTPVRVLPATGSYTSGNCLKTDADGNIVDTGAACGGGGGGSTALSAVTAATAGNTISNGDNAQVWQWAITTASKIAFKFAESAAATGSGAVSVQIATAAASTAIPFQIIWRTAEIFRVDAATGKFWAAGGSGTAPMYSFLSDPGAGMYLVGVGITGFSAGGLSTFQINGTQIKMLQTGSAATPHIVGDLTNNTGFYWVVDVLNIAISGVQKFIFNSTNFETKLPIKFDGATSGATTLQATAIAGSTTLTLPAATDTLVGKATTDILTNKTFDTAGTGNSFAINGTGITAVTGTGAAALASAPTFTNPVVGTQTQNDNSTKAASTAYVDAAISAQNYKEAAKYGSVAALPSIVYNNGSSGVGATLTGVALAAISLDGSSPAVNDRVLIKNQASTFQNGIYTVTATGSGIAVFVLTRATDADQANEYKTGDAVFVTSGSTLSATTWAYTGVDSPTMGTDAITFVQIAGQGSFTASNGVSISGTVISGVNAAADATTKGVASFTAADFDSSSGNISTDYTNGQKASSSVPGFSTANQTIGSFGVTIDGGGSAITTGVKGYVEVPFACTIVRATTLADQSGSVVIDVWKDTYANYPPTVADTITASAKPTISSATKAQDTTLTGWTTSVTAGDVIGFNVDSATTVTRVTLILKCNRT